MTSARHRIDPAPRRPTAPVHKGFVMLPFLKQGSRWVDFLALTVLVGTLLGFSTFLTLAALATESEWRHLFDAQSIALLEQSRTMSMDFDRNDANAR